METLERSLLESYLKIETEAICNINNKPKSGMRPDEQDETVSGMTMTSTFFI
ncbi:hypothetical protein [Olivibacter jilunii]|uniref:hypothetical protein n=1 Tax=Olivibacter jilunii TaxID=985016 RepID=UPI003F157758